MKINNNYKITLVDLKLIDYGPDAIAEYGERFALRAEYSSEDDCELGVYSVIVPLNVDPHALCVRYEPLLLEDKTFINTHGAEIDIGFGYLPNANIKYTRLHQKTKEMTIEEIEERLGHKVKIIGGIKND